MRKNYFLYDKDGQPKLLMNPRTAATIIGDGYGSWKHLSNGDTVYRMNEGRSLSLMAGMLNIYLYAGDFLMETDERTWR